MSIHPMRQAENNSIKKIRVNSFNQIIIKFAFMITFFAICNSVCNFAHASENASCDNTDKALKELQDLPGACASSFPSRANKSVKFLIKNPEFCKSCAVTETEFKNSGDVTIVNGLKDFSKNIEINKKDSSGVVYKPTCYGENIPERKMSKTLSVLNYYSRKMYCDNEFSNLKDMCLKNGKVNTNLRDCVCVLPTGLVNITNQDCVDKVRKKVTDLSKRFENEIQNSSDLKESSVIQKSKEFAKENFCIKGVKTILEPTSNVVLPGSESELPEAITSALKAIDSYHLKAKHTESEDKDFSHHQEIVQSFMKDNHNSEISYYFKDPEKLKKFNDLKNFNHFVCLSDYRYNLGGIKEVSTNVLHVPVEAYFKSCTSEMTSESKAQMVQKIKEQVEVFTSQNSKCNIKIESIEVNATSNKIKNCQSAGSKAGDVWNFKTLSTNRGNETKNIIQQNASGIFGKEIASSLKKDAIKVMIPNEEYGSHIAGTDGPCPYELKSLNSNENGLPLYEVVTKNIAADPKLKDELTKARKVDIAIHFSPCRDGNTEISSDKSYISAPHCLAIGFECLK